MVDERQKRELPESEQLFSVVLDVTFIDGKFYSQSFVCRKQSVGVFEKSVYQLFAEAK